MEFREAHLYFVFKLFIFRYCVVGKNNIIEWLGKAMKKKKRNRKSYSCYLMEAGGKKAWRKTEKTEDEQNTRCGYLKTTFLK